MTSEYRAPRATIDPDTGRTWLRRALPVLLAHRRILLVSLGLSFVGLILQVQIPNMVRLGIDRALARHTASLSGYVWWIAGLAVAQGLVNYLARRYLLRTAYEIEYDLRAIVYTHLTRMSHSFYDRVYTGELMSRSTSDVRAVRMYLAFGPSILVQCMIAVIAFALMLSINVPLAMVAMVTMPVIAVLGVSMRKAIFPVSWLIQARLAGVATVVDENIQGVRIVKAFAAEGRQLSRLAAEAVVGPTGAGKSTLAKLVIRLHDPDSGRVLIDGHDLRDVTLSSLRRQIGVVPQEPYLFAGSIRDNVAFGGQGGHGGRTEATDEQLWAAIDAVGLRELVERSPLGLDAPLHERGQSLSSGERQLLALARTFAAQPRVVVLDEATSNLDLRSERRVEAALDALLDGRTSIIVAHRLSTAARADHIIVVEPEGIVEAGSHSELLARGGRYAAMYATWASHAH